MSIKASEARILAGEASRSHDEIEARARRAAGGLPRLGVGLSRCRRTERIAVVDSLPRADTGKLLKHMLRERLAHASS